MLLNETRVIVTGVNNASAVTPSDTEVFTRPTKAVYIGGAGDLKVDLAFSGTVTFKGLQAGTFYPIQARRIYATGTTATDIVGVY